MYVPLTTYQIEEFDRIYKASNKEKSRGEMLTDLLVAHLNEMTKNSSFDGTSH